MIYCICLSDIPSFIQFFTKHLARLSRVGLLIQPLVIIAPFAGNSIGAFPGQNINERICWVMVNGVQMGSVWLGSLSALTLAFAFVSLTIIKSHRPHLPSLSISTRLFCPGNAPIELPAEEAKHVYYFHFSNCVRTTFALVSCRSLVTFQERWSGLLQHAREQVLLG